MKGKTAPAFKAAVVQAYLEGHPSGAVAELFGIAPPTVITWVKAAGYPTRPAGKKARPSASLGSVEDYLGATVSHVPPSPTALIEVVEGDGERRITVTDRKGDARAYAVFDARRAFGHAAMLLGLDDLARDLIVGREDA